jgi:hypothetical protein
MKRPSILLLPQPTGATLATRSRTTDAMLDLQCTAIHPTTNEALAANHHPATAPMAACPDTTAIGPNEAPARPPAALASEASETRLTYSALVAMAEGSATLMPRLPTLGEFNESDDNGVEWCTFCFRFLNGPNAYLEHLEGKLHMQNVKDDNARRRRQRIPPAPFPI